jgi:hypothetical protein
VTLDQPAQKRRMVPRAFQRPGDRPCCCHFPATALEKSGKSRQDSSSIAQPLGSNGRFDDMRPDYLDREPKATTWAEIIAPPPRTHVSRSLRCAFVVPEVVPDEWDQLLGRIP